MRQFIAALLVIHASFNFTVMIFFRRSWRGAIGLWFCLGLSGCFPATDDQINEQKEPHFLAGKTLVSQMDYPGAVASFERALEVNPRSASAHFELGWLYEEKLNDPVAASYHYERFLGLSPKSGNADLARQHLNGCIVELSKSVSALGTLPISTQRELENLLLENKNLKAQVAQWNAYYARQTQLATNPPPQPQTTNSTPAREPSEPAHVENAPAKAVPASSVPAPRAPAPPTAVTHVIKAGDTLRSIAKKYGVSINALMAANPQTRPTRLQVGRVLNIPAP